jgi:hypothetical protein
VWKASTHPNKVPTPTDICILELMAFQWSPW